eukprot:4320078-Prymnesium_polylepis.1
MPYSYPHQGPTQRVGHRSIIVVFPTENTTAITLGGHTLELHTAGQKHHTVDPQLQRSGHNATSRFMQPWHSTRSSSTFWSSSAMRDRKHSAAFAVLQGQREASTCILCMAIEYQWRVCTASSTLYSE